MLRIRRLGEQTRDWILGSDPGLLRLQTAGRTTLTLMVALLVLYLLTRWTGQPLTVALLGVVIAMMSAMAVNDPGPHQEAITMVLLLVPAAAAVTLGAPARAVPDRRRRRVRGDHVRCGLRPPVRPARDGAGDGRVHDLLPRPLSRATIGQLPWLIAAVGIGTACSFLMNRYLLPDRPERVLRRTLRSLGARAGAIADTASEALQAGQLDERNRSLVACSSAIRAGAMPVTPTVAPGGVGSRLA